MERTTPLGRWIDEVWENYLCWILTICQKSPGTSFWELMNSFVLLACASLTASRTLLQWLLACLNLTLDSEDLSCWYKRKRWFLWTMAASKAAKNQGDEWGLTLYLRCGIYTSIPTWTHSHNSPAAAEALSLKISSYGTSLKWDHPSQQKNCHTVFPLISTPRAY